MFAVRLYLPCILISILVYTNIRAQKVTNVRADFDGEKVIISYDLTSEFADDKFNVLLFSSHDNFQNQLSLVVGDAGNNVQQGVSRKLTWDAKSSLPADYDAEIVFKIKATVAISLHHPNRLEVKPLNFSAFKRGGILNMEWNGGKEGEPITIELLRENELVGKLAQVENNNLYSWSIPKKSKPGKNYSIRISKTASSDIQSSSQNFEIKTKTPLWAKLLPIAVIGGVVAILSSSKDEEPDLPGPVTPGG